MRQRKKEKIQFFAGIILMAFVLLILDTLIYAIIVLNIPDAHWNESNLIEHISVEGGNYRLDDKEKERIIKNNQFAMLLNEDGEIIWSESLPKELQKKYSIQDVVKFVRYYLDEYPVHTYIVKQGILVIGDKEKQVWKYILEDNKNDIRNVILMTPVILLINALVLIIVPVLQQKKYQKRREGERTEWIAGVSHDIRTPLAIILGNTDMIIDTEAGTDISKYTEQIKVQGLRIRRLVENMNLSSKLDFGFGKFEKDKVIISKLLRKTLTEIINQIEDEHFQFDIEIDESLDNLELSVNENLMERVLVNLVNNSIVHNEDGCNIIVRLYKDKRNHILLEVGDDGKGVSEEVINKLNSRNYANEPSSGSHGLGLKIVKKIAVLHRWKVYFEKREGEGFICVIRLA